MFHVASEVTRQRFNEYVGGSTEGKPSEPDVWLRDPLLFDFLDR